MKTRSPFQRFLSELRRRHVPQTAAIYLVAAWAAIQFADVVVPNLDGPQWVVTAVIVAAAAGFPVVILLAWIFEWGPEGIHRTQSEDGEEAARAGRVPPESSGPWVTAVAVLLVGIASALAVAVVLDGADGDAGVDGEETAGGAAAPRGGEDRPGADFDPSDLEDVPGLPAIMSEAFAESLSQVVTRSLGELGQLDSLAAIRDVGQRFGSGRALLIGQPGSWTMGGGITPLAEGDTLRVQGIARDTAAAGPGAGVTAVLVDGEVVAEPDEPRPTVPFATTLVGTGSRGVRTVRITVRTARGAEVVREYRIQQLPAGAR